MVTGLRLLEARAQRAMAEPAFHEWSFPDGTPWARFHRDGGGYMVRFPDLADFTISADAMEVACSPAPATSIGTCEHLYLNQVLPLALSKRGNLVFHASAVELGERAVAFMAESGRGKSTLAASFATSGLRFLADDGLMVQESGGTYRAMPSHPSIRLWDDSEAAVVRDSASAAPAVEYTDKGRFIAGAGMRFCDAPRPLAAAYFLGDGSSGSIAIERLTGAEALVECVRNSFVLDPAEGAGLASHFEQLAALANRLPCFRLDYPRSFGALASVREAILDRHRKDPP